MKIINADCRDAMQNMMQESFDSIVTDPPYGLSFMGKGWDHGVPGVEFWTEALRVAKPGAHLLAFGGTRTYHRLACAIEDAGWEIRDCVGWLYGSGFPKSHNVANAIDKANGAGNRGHAISSGSKFHPTTGKARANGEQLPKYEARTEAGRGWEGWGTALKPAWEPVIVARKPLIGTVSENVLAYGTGAINVDGCRVGTGEQPKACKAPGWDAINKANAEGGYRPGEYQQGDAEYQPHASGRWPANVIHDGSDEVVGLFPMTGVSSGGRAGHTAAYCGGFRQEHYGDMKPGFGDSGSAARFFYCAKASKADRDEGCEGLEERQQDTTREEGRPGGDNPRNRGLKQRTNHHPTVKPTDLMRYLCRLVTPPGGIVLDPFCGSGSTGKAAILEGFDFVGIEQDADYAKIAEARCQHAENKRKEELPL